ncbi:Oxidoreductase domain-containing protein [Trichostrongylus colubriformis]|uniref:Oxidoreductase domain-containing protein n=1 Tax=Trichostrongylus colubriformis TaxID=6319 RepID=A0AAN8IX14_TRICO
MPFEEPISEQLLRMVRKYIAENKEDSVRFEQEPHEPLPQDCCGQSCCPCIFDMHHEDVILWAKDCAKRIPFEGDAFSKDEYRKFIILDITPLSPDTNLYRFEMPKGRINLPIGCHLRTRNYFLQPENDVFVVSRCTASFQWYHVTHEVL